MNATHTPRLARVVDFVNAVNELTASGHISILDAAQAVVDVADWMDLTVLRDSAIELQQFVEVEMLERRS